LKYCYFFVLSLQRGSIDEWWPLFYESFHLPVSIIGILVAAGYGVFTIAGYTAHLFKGNGIEYVLLIISALLFIIVGFGKSVILLPFIFIALFLLKVANVKLEIKFQQAIRGDQRATISSLKSLFLEIGYIGFVLFFGFISTVLGISAIIYLLGSLLLLWIIIFKFFLKIKSI